MLINISSEYDIEIGGTTLAVLQIAPADFIIVFEWDLFSPSENKVVGHFQDLPTALLPVTNKHPWTQVKNLIFQKVITGKA